MTAARVIETSVTELIISPPHHLSDSIILLIKIFDAFLNYYTSISLRAGNEGVNRARA
jgi:hypothetical protein